MCLPHAPCWTAHMQEETGDFMKHTLCWVLTVVHMPLAGLHVAEVVPQSNAHTAERDLQCAAAATKTTEAQDYHSTNMCR